MKTLKEPLPVKTEPELRGYYEGQLVSVSYDVQHLSKGPVPMIYEGFNGKTYGFIGRMYSWNNFENNNSLRNIISILRPRTDQVSFTSNGIIVIDDRGSILNLEFGEYYEGTKKYNSAKRMLTEAGLWEK